MVGQAKTGVFVGIPTMSNRITIQIAALLSGLREASHDPTSEFEFVYSMQNGKSPVEYARNVLVGDFLRTDAKFLWFIDEDMLPTESCMRLVGIAAAGHADIVSAQMYKFDHNNPESGTTVGLGLCAMNRHPTGMYSPAIIPPGSPAVCDVDVVGTACTVISRKVIEDRRLWFPNEVQARNRETVDGNVDAGQVGFAPCVFRTPRNPNGSAIIGEDVDFCERAKALGYSVKVDMKSICGHYKSINIDEAGNLAQEVAKRILGGVRGSDGRVFKWGFEKDVPGPPEHRAVTRDFTLRRATP